MSKKARKTEQVEVPEWGGHALVRGMTPEELARFTAQISLFGVEDDDLFLSILLLFLIRYGIQDPKFNESDLPALRTKSFSALERLARAWMRLSSARGEAINRIPPDTPITEVAKLLFKRAGSR